MPDFEGWAIFAKVAGLRSFSAAAAELNLSPATVSKSISRLESRLGGALIHRSTRTLSLTALGLELVGQAAALLRAGEALHDLALNGSVQPRGLVRIAAPMSFGISHVAPLLPALYDALPEIAVDLQLDDANTDLIASGFDIAVRIGWPRDSTLLARKLFDTPTLLVAAPSYVAAHGLPASPGELAGHDCIAYTHLPPPERWRLVNQAGEEVRVAVRAILSTNNADAMLPLVRAGKAIAAIPEFSIRSDVEAGQLRVLLPGWTMPVAAAYLVTPSSGPRPARVSAVLDFLASRLSTNATLP